MNPIIVVAGGVLVASMAFGTGYWRGHSAGEAEVQQKWDHEKADQLAAYAKAQDEARAREQEMQVNADKLRQEKDREIRDIAARNAALVNSLRDRPTRPAEGSAVPSTSSSGSTACNGGQLYRQDAEFLAGLAAEADQLRAVLNQCYKQYNAAKVK
jgi:hypothetical protein